MIQLIAFVILVFIIVNWLFKENKSDIQKLKEALEEMKKDELIFVKGILDNELKRRIDNDTDLNKL